MPQTLVAVDVNATSTFPYQSLADYNFAMFRGDSFTWQLQIQLNGTAQNITGFTGLRMTAKYRRTDADNLAVFTKTSGSGITVNNASTGLFTIAFTSADTSALDATTDVILDYDIQYTDSSSNPHTVANGKITVRPDVSITVP